MLTWRHFTFKIKQRLIDKASKRNVILHIVGEEYTTKTCGACGYIKNNVGGSKIFNCDNCTVKYDRDLGAVRNIFLKHSRLRCVTRFPMKIRVNLSVDFHALPGAS